jgi:hypothetical protein
MILWAMPVSHDGGQSFPALPEESLQEFEVNQSLVLWARIIYLALKVNFCPPMAASYIKPPLVWTNTAMPL